MRSWILFSSRLSLPPIGEVVLDALNRGVSGMSYLAYLRKEVIQWYHTFIWEDQSQLSRRSFKSPCLKASARILRLVSAKKKSSWEVQGDILVGKRLPSIMELAGCLKSDLVVNDEEIRDAWPKAAAERDERVRKQK